MSEDYFKSSEFFEKDVSGKMLAVEMSPLLSPASPTGIRDVPNADAFNLSLFLKYNGVKVLA